MDLLVDLVVIVGLGVVAPLALGRPQRWVPAAIGAAAALALDSEPLAIALLVPVGVVAAWSVSDAVSEVTVSSEKPRWSGVLSIDAAPGLLTHLWALVAVGALAASDAGLELFGIGEPIVRLTAVHYLYAGVGALTIARRIHAERPDSGLVVAAVLATATAPPIVALGFVTKSAVPQIGGAVLMTVGVWAAAGMLVASGLRAGTHRRGARIIAGLTPWAPMVLAVAWATAQHVGGVPALSVPDMARVHGLANGIGFVIVGLVATSPGTDHLARRDRLEPVA